MPAPIGEFRWETCSDLHHTPRFGDILVTISDNGSVTVKFWQQCDIGPHLCSFPAAWILSIGDMRSVTLENIPIGQPPSFRIMCQYKWCEEGDAWIYCGGCLQLVSLPYQPGLGCVGQTEPSRHNVCLLFWSADGPTGTPNLDVTWWNAATTIGHSLILGVWDETDSNRDMIRRRLLVWIGDRGVPWTKEGSTYECLMRKSEFDNRLEFGPVL